MHEVPSARHATGAPDGPQGGVTFVGAGPGDPEHLTLKALRALAAADVVIHDRLVGPGVLALARTGAQLIEMGKEGFGPAAPQSAIAAALIAAAAAGHRVVRLKGGDCGIFGRLDEETAALDAAGIPWSVVPGLTAATVAAARIGRSLTRRGRNSAVRFATGHDVAGFAEQDWRAMARPGEVAAIYMGKRGARYLQGRLLMHGADAETPVTIVAGASCPDEHIVAATLGSLPEALGGIAGPAVLLYGLWPRLAVPATARRNEASA